MGNSLHGVSLLSRGYFQNYNLQVGNYASIDVTRTETERRENSETERKLYQNSSLRKFTRNWNVLYTIKGSKCQLDLFCDFIGLKVHDVRVAVDDDLLLNHRKFSITETETNLLKLSHFMLLPKISRRGMSNDFSYQKQTKRPSSVSDDLVETDILVYGKGNKGGLLVLESKKKSGDENPYLVTVGHYYASEEFFFDYSYNKANIGLSVIAKFRPSNDIGIDIIVEGPTQHPPIALFYMFDEVMKTGIWKPTTCPHCANIQKQRTAGYGMSSQSDSEDNDKFFRPSQLRGLGKIAESTANNNGAFRGNLNGSFLNMRRGLFFS